MINHDDSGRHASAHSEQVITLDMATKAAVELRTATASFQVVTDHLRDALGVDTIEILSCNIDPELRPVWLNKLVMSLGDPTKVHFAIHLELHRSNSDVVNKVQEAWGNIFEIECRSTWDDETLLTIRPKGGREATTDDIRLATSNDIVVGGRVYIMHGDHNVLFEHVIEKVSDASADYKGFTADDGRRYGLDGTVFILRLDDVPSLPLL